MDHNNRPFIRDHVSRNTKQVKAPYKTFEAASKEAQRMSEQRGYGFSAYLCRYCKHILLLGDVYHVGTDRTSKKSRNRQTLRLELGDRAYMALIKESTGRKRNRYKYIRDKARLVLIIRRKNADFIK